MEGKTKNKSIFHYTETKGHQFFFQNASFISRTSRDYSPGVWISFGTVHRAPFKNPRSNTLSLFCKAIGIPVVIIDIKMIILFLTVTHYIISKVALKCLTEEIFTTLHLARACHQIPVYPDDVPKIAVSIFYGLFSFCSHLLFCEMLHKLISVAYNTKWWRF